MANVRPALIAFLKTLWEIVFLCAITYGTFSLFMITSTTQGHYATINNPKWDPMLSLAGAYAPFLLWVFYALMHKGWFKKVLAFGAVIAATFIMLLVLPYFQHHHVPPAQVMPETG